MTHSPRSLHIAFLFAVIAILNLIWLLMSPSVGHTQGSWTIPANVAVKVSLPYVASTQQPTAPAITSTPLLTGTVGVTYTYAISTTGFPTPTLTIDSGPEGMRIDESGHIEWLPDEEGAYPVSVRASNGAEPDAIQSFTIDVVLDFYWDPRLDQRFATLVEADVQPGQLYYRLIRAYWLNTEESQGRHHIYIDVVDENRVRMAGVPIQVKWSDGETTVVTQEKPGEPHATDFPMNALAPAYSAQPNAGYPADRVEGMGYGEIDDPYYAHHTSYLLTWMLTVKKAD